MTQDFITSPPSLFAFKIDFPMDNSLFESFLLLVSEERKQRAKRFLRHEDACRGVAGEALARYCIGQRVNVASAEITFVKNEHGKPLVDRQLKTEFNIAHSGTWVLCAIDDQPVGVDVERIHSIDLNISKRFFSAAEHEDLVLLTGENKKSRFFDYWTLKESYIKAIGKGLFCPLNSFTILIRDNRIEMKAEKTLPTMFFKQYDLGPEYKCALCASHAHLPEKIVFVGAEEIVSPGLQ
jgi:4'-phosphopantetheinyl transferase